MRVPGAVVLVVLLLTGCTADPAPSPTASAAPPSATEECPEGTSLREELCLADDPIADELSGILHAQFTDAQLGAAIAGVWHDGEPVLVGRSESR